MLHSLLWRTRLVVLAALLLLPLAACDSGGSNDEPAVEDGRVNVSISGEASGSFDGFAYFYEYTAPNTDEPFFGLVLSNTDTETPSSTAEFVTIVRRSSRPGPGTYSFMDTDADVDSGDLQSDLFLAIISSAAVDKETFSFYMSDGGSLTIDQSSEESVSGTFEISATGWITNGSQEPEDVSITVEGAFNANPSPLPFLPFLDDATTN